MKDSSRKTYNSVFKKYVAYCKLRKIFPNSEISAKLYILEIKNNSGACAYLTLIARVLTNYFNKQGVDINLKLSDYCSTNISMSTNNDQAELLNKIKQVLLELESANSKEEYIIFIKLVLNNLNYSPKNILHLTLQRAINILNHETGTNETFCSIVKNEFIPYVKNKNIALKDTVFKKPIRNYVYFFTKIIRKYFTRKITLRRFYTLYKSMMQHKPNP